MRAASAAFREIGAAALLASAIALSGCGELSRVTYSQPEEVAARVHPGFRAWGAQAKVTVSLAEADVEITPYTTRMPFAIEFAFLVVPILAYPGFATCGTDSFEMCIRVKPKASGLSFDPYRVTLLFEDCLIAPVAVEKVEDCACESWMKPGTTAPSPAGKIPGIDAPAAFHLRFPLPQLRPGVPFTLELAGLRAGDRPVPFPVLHYRKAGLWDHHVLPIFV